MQKIKTVLILFVFTMIPAELMAETPSQIIVALNEKPSFPNRGITGTENSENPGVAFETLRLVEKRTGVPFVFVRFPYKRCLHELELGRADAVMTGSYKAEREKSGVYPKKGGKPDPDRRVYNSAYYLYVLKDSQIKWDGSRFHNLDGPVGAELGFSVIDDLRKLGADVRTVQNAESNFILLAKRRLAGVVAHETTGQRFVHRYENMKQIEPPLTSKPYHLLFSHQFYKKYQKLAEKIWDTVAELRDETDEWQTLKEKYFSMDAWPEGGF